VKRDETILALKMTTQ